MIVVYIIVGIIVLLLLAGLVVSKDMAATKDIVINRPNAEVFNYIKYLKNQQHYSKWATLDPGMKNEFRGTDGAPGFVNAWEGNKKVGKGEQEILAVSDGRIDTELRFEKPFRSIAKARMTTEAVAANATKVSWGFKSKMNYPMNVMKLFMNMNEMVGKDFTIGLNNLKTLMEK
ncbi:MAG TPA: SRPBCC family protein [Chitinophagaceae bacterium]|nr:SRPBCC family protein [Chitinophagaceae bacterium]